MRNYDESSVRIQKGLDTVRTSPGMYIGSTDEDGLMHMITEIIHNSVDEFVAGRCNRIDVILSEDKRTVTISDNADGIPTGIHPETGISTVETVATILHAGGKFEEGAYFASGGMHGVGLAVVNALSKNMVIEVKRDGKIYRQEFKEGIPINKLEVVGKTTEKGTTITFTPDNTIMQDLDYNAELIAQRLKEFAYLNKGLKLTFEHNGEKQEYHTNRGIIALVEEMTGDDKVLANPVYFQHYDEERDINVEIALNYTSSSEQNSLAFTNNVFNSEGGKHIEGFRSALTRVVNNLATEMELSTENFRGDEIRAGIVSVVSIKMKERPSFGGQTKGKLQSESAYSAVENCTYSFLSEYFPSRPKLLRYITRRAETIRKSRESLRVLKDLERDMKNEKGGISFLRGKLAAHTSRSKKGAELFIVEGDSAGGTAKKARDSKYQAILPIRGKVLNIERADMQSIATNEEIRSIISAIGCGIGDDINLKNCNYESIIILVDADPDGGHIEVLLLTLLYRYMRELIEAGKVYVSLPPLYKVYTSKKEIYCVTEEEKDEALKQLGPKATIQRYKGLGEMNPSQLRETAMDPKTRTLIQITIEDVEQADKIFEDLMGLDADVRKTYIMGEDI